MIKVLFYMSNVFFFVKIIENLSVKRVIYIGYRRSILKIFILNIIDFFV